MLQVLAGAVQLRGLRCGRCSRRRRTSDAVDQLNTAVRGGRSPCTQLQLHCTPSCCVRCSSAANGERLTQVLQQCLHLLLMIQLRFCNLQASLQALVLTTGVNDVHACLAVSWSLAPRPGKPYLYLDYTLSWLPSICAPLYAPLHCFVFHVCATRFFLVSDIRLHSVFCPTHTPHACCARQIGCLKHRLLSHHTIQEFRAELQLHKRPRYPLCRPCSCDARMVWHAARHAFGHQAAGVP